MATVVEEFVRKEREEAKKKSSGKDGFKAEVISWLEGQPAIVDNLSDQRIDNIANVVADMVAGELRAQVQQDEEEAKAEEAKAQAEAEDAKNNDL